MNSDLISLTGYLLLSFTLGYTCGYLLFVIRKMSEYI